MKGVNAPQLLASEMVNRNSVCTEELLYLASSADFSKTSVLNSKESTKFLWTEYKLENA